MKHVLEPVETPFSPRVAAALDRYPRHEGYILQLFRVFANSLRFLEKGSVNLLDKGSPLTLRQREIVILRVCANNDCEYEWGVHVSVFARSAGLTQAHIAATRAGDHESICWSADEALLVKAVDELCADATVRAPTYARFQETWTTEQQLEILALCGNYHTISFVANTSRLQNESFAARFPRQR
ncbi:carboxymuconolactone decarboxylase family protein [Salinisphaera aquimarina]|uniref:Carboxymuconolactone decarboxylase family protein n=1 Tax=Salinisphaera aquimarina TaxID=2094031 RepID=A0ABV7ETS0_9GAMM